MILPARASVRGGRTIRLAAMGIRTMIVVSAVGVFASGKQMDALVRLGGGQQCRLPDKCDRHQRQPAGTQQR